MDEDRYEDRYERKKRERLEDLKGMENNNKIEEFRIKFKRNKKRQREDPDPNPDQGIQPPLAADISHRFKRLRREEMRSSKMTQTWAGVQKSKIV